VARTILLVEDEPAVRRLIDDVLTHHRYRVMCAGSAEDALRVLCEGAVIDLLVTDVVMPGMDGVGSPSRRSG
jgi:CheY-like chemotaxis protein